MRPELLAAAEAILFASGDAISLEQLGQALELSPLELANLEEELLEKYARPDSGLKLLRLENRLQLCTKPAFSQAVERALAPVRKQTLTQAALETLAVIAYRQPATRGEVEQVRGVKCDYSIQSLLSKGLIREVGRKEALGRPILYGTTDRFLEHFGLSDLRDLPPLPEAAPRAEPPLTP